MKFVILKIFEVVGSFITFARDIKLSHSIFALPFAASIIFLIPVSLPSVAQIGWLLVAMVGARSFAMGFNRFADRSIDRVNPRTSQRAIPSDRLSPAMALLWITISASLLVYAAFTLNTLAGYCSIPLLLILALYSFWKRFSWACHWYLGFCLGLAPIAVCVALSGSIPSLSILLAVSIMFWTAGFDIIYALQDLKFDKDAGLKSIPAKFGPRLSIWLSRICFALMIIGLLGVGILSDAGLVYFGGVLLIAIFLVYEHFIIRGIGDDFGPDKLNKAFFNQNAYVSVLYLATVIVDGIVT